jgi:hypothetical protein
MSASGQTRKHSPRADVFRFSPESGHVICAFMSTRPSALIFSIETLSTSANCRAETYHQPRGEEVILSP